MSSKKSTTNLRELFSALGLLAALAAPLPLLAAEHQDSTAHDPLSSPVPSVNVEKPALSLPAVLQLALNHNPRLSSSRSALRVHQARAEQSGLLPNPTLSMGLENVGISSPTAADEGLEATLFIEQLIELGDKRNLRTAFQNSGVRVAEAEITLARLEIVAETTVAFVQAMSQQLAFGLSEEKTRLAQELLAAVRLLVEKGAISYAEIPRAEVEVLLQQSATRNKAHALCKSRARLATMWGADRFEYPGLSGSLALRTGVPSWLALKSMLEKSPQRKLWDLEIEQSRLAVDVEDAARIPDVRLGMGPKYFKENDEWGLQLGFSVALPVFDRNQGARRESQAHLSRTREDRLSWELKVQRRISEFHEAMLLSYDEARALQEEIIPRAQEAYEATRTAHIEGASSLTAVLDAQRSLFVLQSRLLEAKRAYLVAQAHTELLVGRSIMMEVGD